MFFNQDWGLPGAIAGPCQLSLTTRIYVLLKSFVCLFIHFWLCWVFAAARRRSPVVASRGCSPAAVLGLIAALASLAAEDALKAWGSVVVQMGEPPGKYHIFYFYWSIVNLRCCVIFRCTTKWISCIHIYIHSFLDSFPVYVITEYWVEFPVL